MFVSNLISSSQVISGTPGRVYDMIKRRALKTKEIKMLVIDEADEMLSKGFKEQIYDIYRHLPPNTQVYIVFVRVRVAVHPPLINQHFSGCGRVCYFAGRGS